MKNAALLIVGTTLMAFQVSAAEAPQYSYSLLKDSREQITLPAYSADDKKIVLDQVYLVMNDIFVHRDLKLAHFGNESDPLPLIKNMQENVDSYSDKDFHSVITKIFNKQNDLHTSYTYPKPYACYRSLLPFSFKEVIGLNGEKVVAVSKLSEIEDIIKLVPGLNVKVGDVLVSYNAVPTAKALEALIPKSSGANPDAQVRRSVNLLSLISQKYDLLPERNNAELVFRNRLGETYSVSIPWITRADSKCLAPKEDEDSEDSATNDYQLDFNRIYRSTKKPNPKLNKLNTNQVNLTALKDSADPILKYGVVKNEFGDYGYIRLESFVPEKITDEELVTEIKNILLKELSQTDGLIFDVRSNGGGYIWIAEALVQLFSPKTTVPLTFKLKNSPANRHFMYTYAPENPFAIALKEAEANGSPYTSGLNLNKPTELDLIGQYYFKPVAVFTNASCYSSCDMFSALMQDHGAAIIFGEDSTTGAGGANNRSHIDMVKQLGEELGPFKELPGEQDIGFSYRQSVRTGGVLIEDTGVLSDKIARASISDLYTDSGDQFKIIAQALNQRSAQHTSSVRSPEGRRDINSAEKLSVLLKWTNTDHIEFRVNRETVGQVDVENSNTTGRSFELPRLNEDLSGEYEIIGYKNNDRVWRKIYQYRIVPDNLSIEESLEIKPENLVIYNVATKKEDGWNFKDGSFIIGNGKEYVDNVNSTATIFVELSATKKFTLNFEAAVKSEKDFDYFKVKLVVDGKETDLMENLSGDEAMKPYKIDLAQYQGKKVEIKFNFDSDGGVTDVGPVLKNISLTVNE